MYETWFQLARRPFASAPSTSDFFGAESIYGAQQACERCIDNNSGPSIVVGDPGTGKTMLSLVLKEHTGGDSHSAVVNAAGIVTRKELLQTILFQFGRPYEADDEGRLRLALVDFLTAEATRQTGRLLVIDDAHTLSISLLEELHTLADLAHAGAWCVNLVLVGLGKLEESLAMPSLVSLNQRIAARCYLHGWNREETVSYVTRQLEVANANHVFDADAVDQVYDLTEGTPRLVNQICDHAFVLAAAGSLAKIDKQTVREAWSDLQQLPLPSETGDESIPAGSDSSIVEFGTLDDVVEQAVEVAADPTDGVVTVEPSTCGSSCDAEVERRSPEHDLALVEHQVRSIAAEFAHEPEDDGHASPSVSSVELPSNGNPFLESFDEEEIVLDRFSISNTDLDSSLPRVATQDGLTLVEMLQLIEALEEAGINPQNPATDDLGPADESEVSPASADHEPPVDDLVGILPGFTDDKADKPPKPADYYGSVQTLMQWPQPNVSTSDLYAETIYEHAASPARCIVAPSTETTNRDYAASDRALAAAEELTPAATEPTPSAAAADWHANVAPTPTRPRKRQLGRLFSQLASRAKNESA